MILETREQPRTLLSARAIQVPLVVSLQLVAAAMLFFSLAGDSLREFFTGDDLMNLYRSVPEPVTHWLNGMLHFWSSDYYRPLGTVVYVCMYKLFGFHPLPFRILLLTLLLVNLGICFQVACRVTGSRLVAGVVLLLCSYHAAFNGLYLNFGTIYDILAYLFFFLSLLAFIYWEAETRRPVMFAGVIAGFIAGLAAKEIAISLPAVLFLYDLLFTGHLRRERWRWPWQSGLPVVVSALLGVAYINGKLSGPASLARQPLYTPHYTLHQYASVSANYLRHIFYLPKGLPTPTATLWIFGFMIAAAALLRSRLMLFSAAAVIVTQAPVSLIAPRGAFAIYVAWPFWALYVAALLDRVLALRRRPELTLAISVVLAVSLFVVHRNEKPSHDKVYTTATRAYGSFAEHLKSWRVSLPPDGRVLMLYDPFPLSWIHYDPMFLVSLYGGRPEAIVTRLKVAGFSVPRTEIDSYNYIIDYNHGWNLLRAPGTPETDARLKEIHDESSLRLMDGFGLPSAAGWRPLGDRFTVEAAPRSPGDYVLILSMTATGPARVRAQSQPERDSVEVRPFPAETSFEVPVSCTEAHPVVDVPFTQEHSGGETLLTQVALRSAASPGAR